MDLWWSTNTKDLGGMSHYVDDMAISNHGNLPSQAFVATGLIYTSLFQIWRGSGDPNRVT